MLSAHRQVAVSIRCASAAGANRISRGAAPTRARDRAAGRRPSPTTARSRCCRAFGGVELSGLGTAWPRFVVALMRCAPRSTERDWRYRVLSSAIDITGARIVIAGVRPSWRRAALRSGTQAARCTLVAAARVAGRGASQHEAVWSYPMWSRVRRYTTTRELESGSATDRGSPD